jgi:hypothetical protein
MKAPITFKIPLFTDDQLAGGRYIFPIPFLSFFVGGRGRISVQDGILTYKDFASPPSKSFDLNKMSKLLIVRTKYPRSVKDYDLFRIEPVKAESYLELFLIDKSGEKHILIPQFVDKNIFLSRRQWNKFLDKLKKISCLPLEEFEVTAGNKIRSDKADVTNA